MKVKNSEVQKFLKDLNTLFSVPKSKRYSKLVLAEYPFDAELLSLSRLYRESRKFYLALGGSFLPRVCSTMRSLSSHDLFKDEIEYSPILSEILWFKDHYQEVADPRSYLQTMSSYSAISLFHEQNHRIVWRHLPPAPTEQRDVCRYLNLAESLVITLDLALGDELGSRLSPLFEKYKSIYRPGGEDKWFSKSKEEYRSYLQALLYVSYLALELIEPADIPKAVDYVFPGQKKMNKEAVRRGLELSELFTLNTNRQWQHRYWKKAQKELAEFHKGTIEDTLYLPEDPLDWEEEMLIANRVFESFGL